MAALLGSGALLPPGLVEAKPASYQDRLEARRLGKEGLALYDARRYEDALDRFEQAGELLPAPTLGLHAARCLVALGRLVEAAERYLEVSRFELTRQSPQVHFAARREAREERDELLARIPTLEVDVPSADPETLLVHVDGERLPATLVGQPQPVDPGKHLIVVQRGTTEFATRADLEEGEHTRIVIQLPGSKAYRAVRRTNEMSPLRPWGIAALAAGGAAAAIAGVNGTVALSLHGQLADHCADGCPPEQHSTNDLYGAAGAITTASMVVAGLGFAAGATLLILDPGPDRGLDLEEETARRSWTVTPWATPLGAGVFGQF